MEPSTAEAVNLLAGSAYFVPDDVEVFVYEGECQPVNTLRSSRLEVVGTRKNRPARRRHACLPRARPFSISPTTSKRLLLSLTPFLLTIGGCYAGKEYFF